MLIDDNSRLGFDALEQATDALVVAKITQSDGTPITQLTVAIIDKRSGYELQKSETGKDGLVTFHIASPNLEVTVRPQPPEGFVTIPKEKTAMSILASNWDQTKDIVPFFLVKEQFSDIGISPWILLAALVAGVIIIPRLFKES